MAVNGHHAVAAAALNVEGVAAHVAVLHSVVNDLHVCKCVCVYVCMRVDDHHAVAAHNVESLAAHVEVLHSVVNDLHVYKCAGLCVCTSIYNHHAMAAAARNVEGLINATAHCQCLSVYLRAPTTLCTYACVCVLVCACLRVHTSLHHNLRHIAHVSLACISLTSIGLARTMYIYGVYTVFLTGKSPDIRSYTVYIYGSGQPYT